MREESREKWRESVVCLYHFGVLTRLLCVSTCVSPATPLLSKSMPT